MPPAARLSDLHVCPMVDGLKPHVGGPVLPPCQPTVLIGFMPAARVGDLAVCASAPDVIIKGSPTVLIGGSMAARLGDSTAHGGMIAAGFPTVLIGDVGSGGGGGGGAGSPGGPLSEPEPARLEALHNMGAAAAAFSAAASAGTALVCKGTCTACGQL
jgi:uncharacterized Zn-binding protein involved in type VI secretion